MLVWYQLAIFLQRFDVRRDSGGRVSKELVHALALDEAPLECRDLRPITAFFRRVDHQHVLHHTEAFTRDGMPLANTSAASRTMSAKISFAGRDSRSMPEI